MDVNNYITSGILEDYILGVVSDQERREVECMSHIYPEIRAVLIMIESDMEQFARMYAKKAPVDFRSRLLSEVRKHTQEPVVQMKVSRDEETQEAVVKPLVPKHEASNSASSNSGFLWLAAASVAVLIVAGWLFMLNNAKNDEIAVLQSKNEEIGKQTELLESEVAEISKNINEIYDPAIKKIILSPIKEDFPTQIALFWNTVSGQIKLDGSSLRDLPADKQYQLWVLKDGVPIDMGVLPKTFDESILIAQNATKDGDAFAITIEPLGGQASPSLDQLVVMGNIG